MVAFIIFCFCTTLCHTTEQVYWRRNHAFDDVRITAYAISSISDVKSRVECGVRCAKSTMCMSFSHNIHDRTCHMYSATFTNSASSFPSPCSQYYTLDTGYCPTRDGFVLLNDPKLCFNPHNSSLSVANARNVCYNSESRLIVLDSEEKNMAVSAYIETSRGLFEYFIGLSDDETEGEFLWEDGNATNYTKWNANDHEQNNQGKNCVVLDVESREWTNANCNKPYKYICEKRFVNYGG